MDSLGWLADAAKVRLLLTQIREGSLGASDSADKILVNSEFTAQQFIESFYRLRRAPRVLYPGIDTSTYDPAKVEAALAKLESEGEQNPVKAAIKSLVQAT